MQGGRAFDDARQDAAFDNRFRAMLGAAGASPTRELIVYASDAGNWLAVNAALRARRAGHAQVGWYRGGLAAWQRAGMPVVPKAAVAALN
jgi:3-mercaptopyruvate sulfurtransferase SseA